MLAWLDHIPLLPLAIAAALLGLAPSITEPHLWQKLEWFMAGRPLSSLEVADVVMHASLPVLLMLKLVRRYLMGRGSGVG
ncbi:MAG: RND transporter [Gammaproteobacteria bacterium]|nr:RND transporter [Gammaproteobacteria bacterium]